MEHLSHLRTRRSRDRKNRQYPGNRVCGGFQEAPPGPPHYRLGRFVPGHRQAEFFGFFQFSGKITAFMGPLLLGFVSELFGSQRPGVATVAILFLIGGLLLKSVDEVEGIRAAEEGSMAA